VVNKKYIIKTGRFWQKTITGSFTNDVAGDVTCVSVKCAPFLHIDRATFTWETGVLEHTSKNEGTYIYFVPWYTSSGEVSEYQTYTLEVIIPRRHRPPIKINLPWDLFYLRYKNSLPYKMTPP